MATWKTSRGRAPERLLGWPSRFYGLPNCGMAFAGMHQDPSDLGACANAEFRSEPRHQGEVLPRKNLSDHFWHLLGKSLRESVDSWLQQTGLESTDRLYLYGDSACTHPISSAFKSIAVMSKFLGFLAHAAHMYLQDQSQAKRLYKSATRSSVKSRRCQHHFMVSSSPSLIGEVLLVSLSPTSGALRYDANDSGGRRAQKQAGGRLLHREYQHISSSIAVVQGRS